MKNIGLWLIYELSAESN